MWREGVDLSGHKQTAAELESLLLCCDVFDRRMTILRLAKSIIKIGLQAAEQQQQQQQQALFVFAARTVRLRAARARWLCPCAHTHTHNVFVCMYS
jgi:hypothetical protein